MLRLNNQPISASNISALLLVPRELFDLALKRGRVLFFSVSPVRDLKIGSYFPSYWILFLLIYYSSVGVVSFKTLVSELGFCRGFTQLCHARFGQDSSCCLA